MAREMKKIFVTALVAAPLLANAGSANAQAPDLTGKHFWPHGHIMEICPTPTMLCFIDPPVPAQGFTVQGFVLGGPLGKEFFARVRLDSGMIGFIAYAPGTERIAWATEDPIATIQKSLDHMAELRAKNCTGGPEPHIGMTKQEAIRSWCYPRHINSTTTRYGTHEQWVYGDRYLYFDNDRLTAIQR